MKNLYLLLLLACAFGYSQDAAVVNWIDANAIAIEGAGQDAPLSNLKQNTPAIFNDVKLFGFGEATHHTKEFFDIKARFFKYLAENNGVRVFMIEDGFGPDYNINAYIAGGGGTAKEAVSQMGFSIWMTEEMVALVEWMRAFNANRPKTDRITFYGIDNQFGRNINVIIKNFVAKYNVPVDQNFTAVIDSSAVLHGQRGKGNPKAKGYAKQLADAALLLKNNFKPADAAQQKELDATLHAFDVLQQFLKHVDGGTPKERDAAMASNAIWALQHEGTAAKGFIWAHNEHIENAGGAQRLGHILKATYGSAYYSMGFDFGKGMLYSRYLNGNMSAPAIFTLEAPFKDNYAFVLSQAKADAFFIDFKLAAKDAVMDKFINSNRKNITTGATGYNPIFKGNKQDIAKAYDGLVFVRQITLPTYLK
ncbi:erythromycin esterase family protein [Flavobacterium subsaxonicum]|uniref:Erythromycin esterase n=1 Tax=Flavobacterium subsaxonicum WB 4.1-42 = DSM 21790 TaxID=1121898 RepID=A0A0A2MXL4_9FLAO|nr:erythromycin esterase family protein [Flavobacterium subsaxonicum]KGO92965.1 hypothetical protein Q766_10085 [Flavobacterium subsaxonicum WB 4.1-42 = DSM 21790]